MIDFAAKAVVDNFFAIVFGVLATDLRKERCKPVVVFHRPSIKRMVVALGTLGANAHKHLRDIFGCLQCVAFDLVKVGGW